MLHILKIAIAYIYGIATWILDCSVPKDDRYVVCACPEHQWAGNAKALYEYINSHECGFIAYRYNAKYDESIVDNKILNGRWSWHTICILLRAKYIVTTHGVSALNPYRISKKKIVVETWHGVPLKGQKLTDAGLTDKVAAQGLKYWENTVSIFVASSRIAAYSMCVSCRLNPRKICLAGQPRNDQLIMYSSGRNLLRSMVNIPYEFSKVVLYAPTYRRDAHMRLLPFDDFDIDNMNEVLIDHDAVLLLRGHVMASVEHDSVKHDRIYVLNSDGCPDINDVLAEVSVLITDYSSIYYDFLLLDKPIVFAPYDYDQYLATCGFVVDDYDFWTPGPKVFTFADLLNSLRLALDHNDGYGEQRQLINRLVNFYDNGHACEKVVACMNDMANSE